MVASQLIDIEDIFGTSDAGFPGFKVFEERNCEGCNRYRPDGWGYCRHADMLMNAFYSGGGLLRERDAELIGFLPGVSVEEMKCQIKSGDEIPF